ENVELIVPYSAGGGVGAMARVFAQQAQAATQQNWVVMHREGAGGVVGFTALANARPTGYTVMFSPASPLTNSPFVNPKMPFQAEQIEPVCQIFENVFSVAVTENSTLKSFNELVAKAKSQPGAVSYGHAGPASVPHLSLAAIERDSGMKLNAIAYRGDAPAIQDLMGGVLDFSAPAISSLPGKPLRVLAVLSDKRHPAYADVPTVRELGYTVISPGLNGLYVPKGTPAPVVARLEAICKQVTQSPAFAESAKSLYQVPSYLPAAQFKERIAQTYKVHAALVPGMKLEAK
ncbi:MAG: tripartite tricarboxylate transporter substrate binding protein, partial [Comamonadaceae bacterium]